jgi:hypothetical protein
MTDFGENTTSFNIGNLFLLEAGVSQVQLDQALTIQTKQPERKLGEILIAMGVLTQAALDAALRKQETWRKVGPSRDDVRRMSDLALEGTAKVNQDLDTVIGDLRDKSGSR